MSRKQSVKTRCTSFSRDPRQKQGQFRYNRRRPSRLSTGLSPSDVYLHIRVLFSMILGLGVARLLGGVAPIVQHEGRQSVLGSPALGPIPVSLPDSLTVVRIPAPRYATVDLSALLLRCPFTPSCCFCFASVSFRKKWLTPVGSRIISTPAGVGSFL